ncbi:MAG: hypothetical protein WCC58_03320 [Burkholderiales bacterium]
MKRQIHGAFAEMTLGACVSRVVQLINEIRHARLGYSPTTDSIFLLRGESARNRFATARRKSIHPVEQKKRPGE